MKASPALRTLSNRIVSSVGFCLLALFLSVSMQARALETLDDGAMADISGAGVALAFDNFSSRFAPTSFINLLGSDLVNNTSIVYDQTLNGNTGGCRLSSGGGALAPSACDPYDAPANWRRGDLYYYGLSMTGGSVGQGMDWYGTGTVGGGCAQGTDGLGCPIGRSSTGTQVEGIKNWASVYNPYMIRVFQYAGYSYEGTCLGTEVSGKCSQVLLSGTNASPTYYEFVGPSKGDKWRWAFWGELLVNNGSLALGNPGDTFSGTCYGTTITGNCAGILKSQTIILGNNFTLDNKATRLQIVQTPTNVASEQSLSVIYQSRLSGDFRFSVAQQGTYAASVAHGIVPDFNDVEGMYFKNVDAFLPLGQNNYQTVVFRNNGTSGNFTVELTPIANNANVSNTFYCGQNNCSSFVTNAIAEATGGVGLNGSSAAIGCVNQLGNVVACTGIYDRSVKVKTGSNCTTNWTSICDTAENIINPANANSDSHGYVYWGTPAETRSGVTGVAAPAACTAPCNSNTTNGIYFRAANGDVTNIGRAKVTGMLIQMMKVTSLGVGP